MYHGRSMMCAFYHLKLNWYINYVCQYNVMKFKAIHSIKKNVIKIKTCPLTFIPLIQPIHAWNISHGVMHF